MVRLGKNPAERKATVLLLDKGYNYVNLCRQKMFTVGLKQLASIPSILNVLYQHVRRSLLICAFQWSFCLDNYPPSPDPNEWGWEWNTRTRSWVSYWTDLPDVSEGCSVLIHCGFKVSCRGNCKCFCDTIDVQLFVNVKEIVLIMTGLVI